MLEVTRYREATGERLNIDYAIDRTGSANRVRRNSGAATIFQSPRNTVKKRLSIFSHHLISSKYATWLIEVLY